MRIIVVAPGERRILVAFMQASVKSGSRSRLPMLRTIASGRGPLRL
jgi:hypothetical protein